MLKDVLKKAEAMARRVGTVLVATADAEGRPHVAAAGAMSIYEANCVGVTAWFCPGTVRNLGANRNVTLVVWDRTADQGYQLLGQAEQVEELAYADGGPVKEELEHQIPQVERRVIVRVSEVLTFTQAPHGDLPL